MDRRTVWALILMMVIAIVPAIFIKRTPAPASAARQHADSTARSAAPPTRAAPEAAPDTAVAAPADTAAAAKPAAPAATVHVTSPLYTYGISTVGGRLVEARL